MVLVDCRRCGRRELRGVRSFSVRNTDRGILLAWTCRHCDAPQHDLVGRRLPGGAVHPAVA
jgi:hypothetical protein